MFFCCWILALLSIRREHSLYLLLVKVFFFFDRFHQNNFPFYGLKIWKSLSFIQVKCWFEKKKKRTHFQKTACFLLLFSYFFNKLISDHWPFFFGRMVLFVFFFQKGLKVVVDPQSAPRFTPPGYRTQPSAFISEWNIYTKAAFSPLQSFHKSSSHG